MSRFIWVIGPSGVGKATAVELCKKPGPLTSLLKLDPEKVLTVYEEFYKTRMEEFFKLLNAATLDQVLVSSQWESLGVGLPGRLLRSRRESEHLVVMLHCDLREIVRRVRERGIATWAPGYSIEAARGHAEKFEKEIVPSLQKDGLKVMFVDSSNYLYQEREVYA